MARFKLDFNEMLKQFETMRKTGSMKEIMKMIPGLSKMLPEGALDAIDDRTVERAKAIIRSMTPAERAEPDLLDPSRMIRIANGSGTSLRDVSDLLVKYYEMRRHLS